MAMPSSTQYLTSSFSGALVVVAMFFLSYLSVLGILKPFRLTFLRIDGGNDRQVQLRVFGGARQDAMEEDADDGVGKLLGARIDFRFMPFVDPIHHAEKAENGDARVEDGGGGFGCESIEDFAGQVVVAALDGGNFLAKRVLEGLFFVREYSHFAGVGEEVFEMVLDQEA